VATSAVDLGLDTDELGVSESALLRRVNDRLAEVGLVEPGDDHLRRAVRDAINEMIGEDRPPQRTPRGADVLQPADAAAVMRGGAIDHLAAGTLARWGIAEPTEADYLAACRVAETRLAMGETAATGVGRDYSVASRSAGDDRGTDGFRALGMPIDLSQVRP
jgi:hypothetical protein